MLHKDNKGVTGQIPLELKVLHDLTYLDLSSNQLSGPIPTSLSLLGNLGEWVLISQFMLFFVVRNKNLYCCVKFVETLILDDNNLSGPVPQQICSRHDQGVLMHIKTDCKDGGQVQCQCCENCSKFDNWESNQKATWNRLKTLSGDKLNDPNSPQYKAAHWIVESDKWQYPSNSGFLYQRYVLILLYKMMGSDSLFSPDAHSDECKWQKVSCNNEGYVEHIEFGKILKHHTSSIFVFFSTCL